MDNNASPYLPFPKKVWKRIKKIGEGGSGKVYKVKNRNSGEIKAVKITDDEDEISIVRRFNHRNVVNFHDVYHEPEKDRYWAVMDLYRCDIYDMEFTQDTIIGLILDILKALAYLETFPIVHNDIGKDNILLGFDGQYALCDFDICIEDPDNWNEDFPHIPEILNGKGMVGNKSDIWEFGRVIMYTLLPESVERGDTEIGTLELNKTVFNEQIYRFLSLCLSESTEDRPYASELLELGLFSGDANETTAM